MNVTVNPAPPHPSRRRRAVVAVLLAVSSSLALGGCLAGSGSGSTSAGRAEVGDAAAAAPLTGAAPAVAPAGKPSRSVASVALTPRLVRTASLLLRVTDVLAGAADVRAIAAGAGGAVTAEDLVTVDAVPGEPAPPVTPVARGGVATSAAVTDPSAEVARKAAATAAASGSTSGTMTVSVPEARLSSTLDQLSRLGTVTQRSTSTQDVTTTYVDTASRIATMTASITRVRALMGQATGVGQVVSLESELSRREADLESLKAQLAALDQRTTMATITLSLATAGATSGNPVEGSGFLSGLRAGWSGFVSVVTAVAVAVGAALPFVVTLAVLGVPVLGWRRRRAQRAAASGAA